MSLFLLRRFVFMVATLLFVSVLIFAVTEVLPGDVATAILGRRATEQNLAALREQLGLNHPPVIRYFNWLGGMLQGDWGDSLTLKVPIYPLVTERLGYSLTLASLAFLIGVPLGLLLGIIAGLMQDSWVDHLISSSLLALVSVPEFVLATLGILIFSYRFQILPATSAIEADMSWQAISAALILPTLTLVLGMLAHVGRMMRSSIAEVMHSQYIRTATLKGLPMRTVIFRHALPNALLPTISVIALEVGYLLGGIVVIENVFAYPGLGRLMLRGVTNQDLPLLQAVTLIMTFAFMFANFLADMLYMILNPRIRYQ